jgi:phosphoribosylanthranilate isomerase
MTWIKICGITNAQDAQAAVDAGADALGFVFAPSTRQVLPATARAIVATVPSHIEKIGVFVDERLEHVLDTVVDAGLTAVQLHGTEPLEYSRELARRLAELSSPVKMIRAAHLPALKNGREEALGWDPVDAGVVELDAHSAEPRPGVFAAVLLDSAGSVLQAGGTGTSFDWHHSRTMVGFIAAWTKVIVAGGLNHGNVAEAIETLHPWGVDVSSGVEQSPGKKDPEKIKALVVAVRSAERRL